MLHVGSSRRRRKSELASEIQARVSVRSADQNKQSTAACNNLTSCGKRWREEKLLLTLTAFNFWNIFFIETFIYANEMQHFFVCQGYTIF